MSGAELRTLREEDAAQEERIARVWEGVGGARTRRRERARQRRRVGAALGVSLMLLGGAQLLRWYPMEDPGPLAFDHRRERPETLGGGVHALSDGSSLQVGADGEVAVEANDGAHFDVALERGWARFDVEPGGPRRWRVDAGDFVVEVLGTSFTIARDSARTAVRVHRGVVEVHPRDGGSVRQLTRGESFAAERELDLAEASISRERAALELSSSRDPVAAPPSAVPAVAAPDAAEATSRAEPAAREPTRPSGRPTQPTGPSWEELARGGELRGAFELAGLPALRIAMRRAEGLSDLLLIADVARAGQEPRIAAEALRIGLERFPRDRSAGVAAYALGRLELRSLGAAGDAAQHFAQALELGVPSALAEAALARRVEALSRTGSAETRSAAEAYLGRFPNGAYRDAVLRWSE